MYLLRETSIFCSHYFETGVPIHNKKLPQNDDGAGDEQPDDENESLDIFSYLGCHYGKVKTRLLSNEEFNVAHSYIFRNEYKIKTYIW